MEVGQSNLTSKIISYQGRKIDDGAKYISRYFNFGIMRGNGRLEYIK
jgi:hypothetical protein